MHREYIQLLFRERTGLKPVLLPIYRHRRSSFDAIVYTTRVLVSHVTIGSVSCRSRSICQSCGTVNKQSARIVIRMPSLLVGHRLVENKRGPTRNIRQEQYVTMFAWYKARLQQCQLCLTDRITPLFFKSIFTMLRIQMIIKNTLDVHSQMQSAIGACNVTFITMSCLTVLTCSIMLRLAKCSLNIENLQLNARLSIKRQI